MEKSANAEKDVLKEDKSQFKAVKKNSVFSAGQLAESRDFKRYGDIIRAVIGDDEKVTKAEAQKRIDSFLKRRVD